MRQRRSVSPRSITWSGVDPSNCWFGRCNQWPITFLSMISASASKNPVTSRIFFVLERCGRNFMPQSSTQCCTRQTLSRQRDGSALPLLFQRRRLLYHVGHLFRSFVNGGRSLVLCDVERTDDLLLTYKCFQSNKCFREYTFGGLLNTNFSSETRFEIQTRIF
jgi:hypothetical protein